MAGLRAKQKQQRQQRILEAARRLFKESDYRSVTVEAIAAEADLSPMTVFNYYGSKGGLLLSLVAESDRHLVKKINAVLETRFQDFGAAITAFSLTIIDHGFSYLDRRCWGNVWATAILEGNSTFGRGFFALERELVRLLSLLLDRLKTDGLLDRGVDSALAANVIYNVHNARFIEYAANSDIARSEIEAVIRNEMKFVAKLVESMNVRDRPS
jgi:AcrR family transcriptional regulator